MKNVIKVVLVATGIFSFTQSYGNTTMPSDTAKHVVGKTIKKIGHATAHTAASGASDVVDKKYDGKCGPQGQTVYINKYSHYYYINKSGHRVYTKKSQLMDKPMK